MYLEVLIEIKARKIDKTFTYNVPKSLIDKIKIGIRVKVPFGKQILEGFVLSIKENLNVDYVVKDIIDVIDDKSILNEELLALGKYMSKKTLANLISCYQTMLPTALKAKNGLVINKKYVTYLKINKLCDKLNETQKQIINLFNEKDLILKSEASKISISSLKTLLSKEILIEVKKEQYRYNIESSKKTNNVILNQEQKNAVEKVINSLNKFEPFLLFGVTGSGKTEVYMNIINEVIKTKSALVLVPEISLTPQFINNFKNRFGSNIAVLHSRLSDGEKYDEWRKIENNEVKIIIGARSAVFAPIKNIGIIVIDEEHSDSYKQENNPKYNTIDMALFRAKWHQCPLLLGSATPSIESYTRANNNIYTLLELKYRVNKKTPTIITVDMREEIKKGYNVLSEILINKINEALYNNLQIILLLNRRGYSTVISCHNCGYVSKCPNCDIPLTHHKSSNNLRCHYCGFGDKLFNICPICKSHDINEFGIGTEQLETIIKEKFINAKVIRMDIDTTVKKNSHEKIINSFKNKEYNILIGTQMVAKGLDFNDVTLVGVINGDAGLNIPDFRSGERTFSLINQVSGRAGRADKDGLVIIQGFNIDNYSIKYATQNDYISFYNHEMSIRKKLKYPPYYNLCLIKTSSKNYELLKNESEKIKNYLLSSLDSNLIILGPTACNPYKINNIYYMQIIIKYKKTSSIIDTMKFISNKFVDNKINVEIDLNPLRI